MSKSIHAAVQASIDSKNYTGVVLARLEFLGSDAFIRVTNAYQTIYWDEDGGGEVPYYGIGDYGEISTLPETSELGAIGIQLRLSGIPNDIIQDAFSDDYRNQPVYVWYATLNKNTFAVEGGKDGPVLAFAGIMDYANIEFGEMASVVINATSRLADWERPRGGTFNHHYQKTYVDPTDSGFQSVLALQNKEVAWGAFTLDDKRSAGSGRGRG